MLSENHGLHTSYSVKNKDGEFESVVSVKSAAEITEQIAVEFAEWLGNAEFQILKSGNWTKNWGLSEYSLKTLFQEFLKTKHGQ